MNYRILIKSIVAACLCLIALLAGLQVDAAIAGVDRSLLYDQVKGTGLANRCPTLFGGSRGRGLIPIAKGETIQLTDICLEPTEFYVKEEAKVKGRAPEFVPGKMLTRATSTIDFVKAKVTANTDGSLTLVEEEGLDYQPITVQLPGGERVPFLFSIKNLVATSQPGLEGLTTSTDFEGKTQIPSYRGASFIDPKGRGLAIGYDAAEALPARRDEFKESTKIDEFAEGRISMEIARLNSETGEFAGTFEAEQPSDTDLGANEPKEVRVRGVFYGRVSS